VAWAEYFAGKGREYGVPVCWWDNGAFTGNGENFGLLNRRELKWEYPEIVEAFNG
jgi:endoglucanase